MVLENKDILIRYLLGELPEEDLERLAEEYFVRDEAWQALSAIESDLIDDYVRGQLPQTLQKNFESRFMSSPARRERVEFAKILMNFAVREQAGADATQHPVGQNARNVPAPSRSWARRPVETLGLAVAGLALVSIIVVLAVQNGRLRNNLRSMQSAQTELQHRLERAQEEAANRLKDPNGPVTPPLLSAVPTISILLSPGVLRNNESVMPTLQLTAGWSVELALDLEQDQYAEYEAIIKTADGQTIRRVTGLKSRPTQNSGRVVSLNVPSQLLKKNAYIVTLFGRQTGAQVKTIDSYVFSVSRP